MTSTILGQEPASYLVAKSTVLGNIAPPKPDIYYGKNPEVLAQSACNKLAGHIIPSTMLHKPMMPGVSIEVKGLENSPAVAIRQARCDGAIGSWAIHSLQNDNEKESVYDSSPWAFTAIYYGCSSVVSSYGMYQLENNDGHTSCWDSA